jgi:ABC-2 type transport system permease protein
MGGIIIIAIVVIIVALRIYLKRRPKTASKKPTTPKRPLGPWGKKLLTVAVFTKLNTRRFFRDRLALFFGILFPLIFLTIFGLISKGNGTVSFSVAVINQSKTPFANQLVHQLQSSKTFKVSKSVTTFDDAKERMARSQLDGTIILPADFGVVKNGIPTGHAKVYYTASNEQAGQTLTTVLQGSFNSVNAKFVATKQPLVAQPVRLSNKSLTSFDYAFAGLLGFSIIGLGIFGPINIFPELKKQGILRRLHTTPIRVWQYFLSTALSQAIIGLFSIAIMFIVAIEGFGLKVVGNYLEIILFTVLSIFMILGIGLAIGGWAKNERQAAPLANIVVFPMLFLSGTFFPRFGMPVWLQSVTNWLPLTPVIDGIRLLTTEGKHLVDIGPQVGLIFAWMIVVYIIAFRVFRWE